MLTLFAKHGIMAHNPGWLVQFLIMHLIPCHRICIVQPIRLLESHCILNSIASNRQIVDCKHFFIVCASQRILFMTWHKILTQDFLLVYHGISLLSMQYVTQENIYYMYFVVMQHFRKNSLHLACKYAWIFVRGHYLFRVANSFGRASLEENCELPGTYNVSRQISEHTFQH